MQLSAADLPASTDSRLVDLVARLTDQDACVRPHSAAALYEELQNLRESLLKESRAALERVVVMPKLLPDRYGRNVIAESVFAGAGNSDLVLRI